ncbi:hypothetical protein A3731_21930 [Roseovarius sp. HI0049]|nr:hypothetical protein A3731_21930 [Roseovarius sp. HI0049]
MRLWELSFWSKPAILMPPKDAKWREINFCMVEGLPKIRIEQPSCTLQPAIWEMPKVVRLRKVPQRQDRRWAQAQFQSRNWKPKLVNSAKPKNAAPQQMRFMTEKVLRRIGYERFHFTPSAVNTATQKAALRPASNTSQVRM